MAQHTHGGNADGWIAPVQTRDERPWSHDPADFGPADRRDPMWKLSDLDRLAPLLAVEAPEEAGDAPADFRPEDVLSAKAWRRGGTREIRITGDQSGVTQHVDLSGTNLPPNVLIVAEPNSVGTIVLEHSGAARYAQNVHIRVEEAASLTVVSVQEWADDAVHSAAHQALVGRGARLKHIVISLGGGVVRLNTNVRLEGEGADARLLGLAFADAKQHLESQVFLHHVGPHTTGDVVYKSALQGEHARTVWVGDVLIGRDAVGTSTYEQNRNLLLTEGARADSIPNLEIETGEISGAGHASATGRFDDAQLFYLMSRGIPEAEARRLVVIGFLAEILQHIEEPELLARLTAAVESEIATELPQTEVAA